MDIESGTRINFSDLGYRSSDGFAGANEEGVVIWTATTNLSAGTVVKISTTASGFTDVANVGSAVETTISNATGTGSFQLSTAGDQIVAWQDAGAGAFLPTSSNTIAAVNAASSDWGILTNSNGSIDSNTSELYPGLTDGVNAVAAGQGAGPQDEHDNTRFDPALFCSLNNKTKEQILAIVNNQNNWLPGPGATANGDPFPDYFTSVSGCSSSSVTVSPPPIVINEVLADPDGTTGDANGDGTANTSEDEFIEIINVSALYLEEEHPRIP